MQGLAVGNGLSARFTRWWFSQASAGPGFDSADVHSTIEVDAGTTLPEPRLLEDVAGQCGKFLHTRRNWIHRRVLKLSFPENGTARTEISIDFTIERDFPPLEQLADGRGVYFVPLDVLAKWPPPLRLDLRDQHGEPIPLLTTAKNQAVDARFLVGSAPEGAARDEVTPFLVEIPRANEKRVRELLDEEIIPALVRHIGELSPGDREQWAETLRLAMSLGSNLLFWARVTARPGERVIVKLCQEASYGPEARRNSLLWRVAGSLSWAPWPVRLVIHDMAGCNAYHVQVDVPEGLEVHRATLRMVPGGDAPSSNAGTQAPSRHSFSGLRWSLVNTLRVRWWLFRRGPYERYDETAPPTPGEADTRRLERGAHMFVTGTRQRNAGVAELDLASSRSGLRRAAFVFGIATTLFLAAVTIAVPGISDHLDGAVPALLVTPALIAVLVVNPGEHQLVRQRLLGVRAVVALIAVLPLAATLSLLSFVPSHGSNALSEADLDALQLCFVAISSLSLLLTVVLGLSWLLPPVKTPLDEIRPRPVVSHQSQPIDAPPDRVVELLADVAVRSRILPAPYRSVVVEDDDVLAFAFSDGADVRSYRLRLSLDPGHRTLTEQDERSAFVNAWQVIPDQDGSIVFVTTQSPAPTGLGTYRARRRERARLERMNLLVLQALAVEAARSD